MINVLIVDDSSIIRTIFSKDMAQMGFNVIGIAKDGKDAIRMYEKFKPDLVTMDITMPIMTGIESLKKIRSIYKEAVIVMVTSRGEERLVMDAISAGAKGYLLKPITPEKIQNTIVKLFPEIENMLSQKDESIKEIDGDKEEK